MTQTQLNQLATDTFNDTVDKFSVFPDDVLRPGIDRAIEIANTVVATSISKAIVSGGCPIEYLQRMSAVEFGIREARNFLLDRIL